VGIRCADHATHFYQLKLALTSSAGCGRLVDIVRLRTKTTEFFFNFKNFNFKNFNLNLNFKKFIFNFNFKNFYLNFNFNL
jgi:hypothetical protein